MLLRNIEKRIAKQLARLVPARTRTPRLGSFVATQILIALEKIGFFNKYFRPSQKFFAKNVAEEFGVRPDLLFASLAYLVEENILEMDGAGAFSLAIDYNQGIAPHLNWSLAYKDVYDSIAELLTEKKLYGKDLVRDAVRLGYSSRLNIPFLVQLFKKSGIKSATDIGCGTANFLLALAEGIPGFRGFGIDIDKAAVALAKKRIELSLYKNSITVLEGDAGRPESFPAEAKAVDAFYAVGVLHEFNKNNQLTPLLKKYKTQFPHSKFILLEDDTPSWSNLLKEPDSAARHIAAQYLFIHYFTEQGLPQSKDKWLKILKEAGWRVSFVQHLHLRGAAFVCE